MFDALLGRGFAGKCKSSVSKLRGQLDMVKRKKKVILGYLKKDIAELLQAGHDKNAYDRVEGLMVEMHRATCYELIDKFCDCIIKQLSTMKKQANCPDEVKEAVSSLIYAAAGISELPELCFLRHIFSDKYGSSVESFVNQELVEKIASKPPSMDQKLQTMQDVCKEFSVKWDLKACKQKISATSKTPYVEPPKSWPSKNGKNDAPKEYKKTPPRGRDALPTMPNHPSRKEINQIEKEIPDEKIIHPSRRRDIRPENPHEKEAEQDQPTNKRFLDKAKDDAAGVERFSLNEGELPSRLSHTPKKENNSGRRDALVEQVVTRSQTPDHVSNLRYARKELVISSNKVYHGGKTDAYNHPRPSHGESMGNEKLRPNRVIPPPYVRPNKIADNREAAHAVPDRNEPTVMPKEEFDHRRRRGSHHINHGRTENRYDRDEKKHHEEILVKELKPEPRSVRRKSAQPSPLDEVVDKFPKVATNIPVETKGRVGKWAYPTMVVADEEEKAMDRLLIHLSKKTTSDDDGLVGLKGLTDPPNPPNAETKNRATRVVERVHSPHNHAPNRIASLPTEPPPEVVKLSTRAASFQHDKGPHVHPKLPDYDELAARFAASKAK